jgi:hypothetical protein
MSDDVLARELSDRFLPPEPPEFFDAFWARTAAREHREARRWRRVTLAVAVVALSAVSAAAVVAAPFGKSDTVDQSVSCALRTQGKRTVINLAVAPTRKAHEGYKQSSSAQLLLVTGASWFVGTKLVLLDNAAKGYIINRNLCTSGPRLTLARRGLPRQSVLPAGVFIGYQYRCLGTGRVDVRVKFTTGSKGEPTRAQLAVAVAKTHKPLLYAEWSPAKVTTYARNDCEQSEF